MKPPLVANAADAGQVQRADKKQRHRRLAEIDDLRQMLATVVGRRVLWARLEKCGIYQPVWEPSGLMAFKEGRRNVGLELLKDIMEADDNAFIQMQIEARSAEVRDTDRAEIVKDTDDAD